MKLSHGRPTEHMSLHMRLAAAAWVVEMAVDSTVAVEEACSNPAGV